MGDAYDPVKNFYRVGPMYFRHWFICFFEECYEEYKQYCSSGSIKKEKTLKRIEIMEASLIEYFELEDTDTDEQPNQDVTQSDDSTPLTDANAAENGLSVENETEDTDSQEISEHASVAEDTDLYTASERTETIEETKSSEETA